MATVLLIDLDPPKTSLWDKSTDPSGQKRMVV